MVTELMYFVTPLNDVKKIWVVVGDFFYPPPLLRRRPHASKLHHMVYMISMGPAVYGCMVRGVNFQLAITQK